MKKDRPEWNERYREGDLPWETGKEDANLVSTVSERGIEPCKALEIGCGTGNNAIWLAKQGFDVTALDISPLAIESAVSKSAELPIAYHAVDVISSEVPGAPYGFVFDRGCFHSIEGSDKKAQYVKRVQSVLSDAGLWLSLIGNADEPEREMGPPKMTAEEIACFVEPCFEILSLQSSRFDSDNHPAGPPRCWRCLMRRR